MKTEENTQTLPPEIRKRFRGFLPVVVDVETGGVRPNKDALLEIAAVTLKFDDNGYLVPDQTYHHHVMPFEGAHIDPESLKINGIEPFHPFRLALEEKEALEKLFRPIQERVEETRCQRAVLVGHNAWFDLCFLQAACQRTRVTSPFHKFTSFDTATLSGLVLGETILAKAIRAAGIKFSNKEAHSAQYDTEKTAELFCYIVNRWKDLNL